jgi:hypothetical protein
MLPDKMTIHTAPALPLSPEFSLPEASLSPDDHLLRAAEHIALAALHASLAQGQETDRLQPIAQELSIQLGEIERLLPAAAVALSTIVAPPEVETPEVTIDLADNPDGSTAEPTITTLDDVLPHPVSEETPEHSPQPDLFDDATRARYQTVLGKIFGDDSIQDLHDSALIQLFQSVSSRYTDMTITRLSSQAKQDRAAQLQLHLDGKSNLEIAQQYGSTREAISQALRKFYESFNSRVTPEELEQTLSNAQDEVLKPEALDAATTEKPEIHLTDSGIVINNVWYAASSEQLPYLDIMLNLDTAISASRLAAKLSSSDDAATNSEVDVAEEALIDLHRRGIVEEVSHEIDGEILVEYRVSANPEIGLKRRNIVTIDDKVLYLTDLDVDVLQILTADFISLNTSAISRLLSPDQLLTKPVFDKMARGIKKYLIPQGIVQKVYPPDSQVTPEFQVSSQYFGAVHDTIAELKRN